MALCQINPNDRLFKNHSSSSCIVDISRSSQQRLLPWKTNAADGRKLLWRKKTKMRNARNTRLWRFSRNKSCQQALRVCDWMIGVETRHPWSRICLFSRAELDDNADTSLYTLVSLFSNSPTKKSNLFALIPTSYNSKHCAFSLATTLNSYASIAYAETATTTTTPTTAPLFQQDSPKNNLPTFVTSSHYAAARLLDPPDTR
jgi:hypothetical protein